MKPMQCASLYLLLALCGVSNAVNSELETKLSMSGFTQPSKYRRSVDAVCHAGDTKREKCNWCRCESIGLWTCTRQICSDAEPPQPPVTAPSLPTQAPTLNSHCKAGDTRMINCNYCFCTNNGLWSCTFEHCMDMFYGHLGGNQRFRDSAAPLNSRTQLLPRRSGVNSRVRSSYSGFRSQQTSSSSGFRSHRPKS